MREAFTIRFWHLGVALLAIGAIALGFTAVSGGFICDSATSTSCLFGTSNGSLAVPVIVQPGKPDGGAGASLTLSGGNAAPYPDGGAAVGGAVHITAGQNSYDGGVPGNANVDIGSTSPQTYCGSDAGQCVVPGQLVCAGGTLGCGGTQYTLAAYRCVFSAQSSTAYNSDGTYSVCGANCRVMNTANSSPTPRITNGTGLVFTPTAGTYSNNSRTMPMMACPLVQLFPGLTFYQGWRALVGVSQNGADLTHNIAAIIAVEMPANPSADITCTSCSKLTYLRHFQNAVSGNGLQWHASDNNYGAGDSAVPNWGCNCSVGTEQCCSQNFAVLDWGQGGVTGTTGIYRFEEDWYSGTLSGTSFGLFSSWNPMARAQNATDVSTYTVFNWGQGYLSQTQPVPWNNIANWNLVIGAQYSSGSSAAVTYNVLQLDVAPATQN